MKQVLEVKQNQDQKKQQPNILVFEANYGTTSFKKKISQIIIFWNLGKPKE